MRSMWLKVSLALAVGVVAGCPPMVGMRAQAQAPLPAMMIAPDVVNTPVSAEAERIAALEKQVAAQTAAIATAQTSGDNAWMLTSAALVLLMTGPGLALFYGGLVRKKNVLGTMMQSFAMMAVITLLWAIVSIRWPSAAGTRLSAGCTTCFCRGWGWGRARTRRPFRYRRSWCIN